jgi:RimJ/RimL family protein N-acetyltransferase
VDWAITDAEDEEFLGWINLHAIVPRHRRAELGIWLARGARGRGVASRALTLVIEWAFAKLDVERLDLTTTPENDRMIATAERLGFVREGLLRGHALERGKRVDVVWLGLLRHEWSGGTGASRA